MFLASNAKDRVHIVVFGLPRCKQYLHCFWAPQAKILCLPRLNITGMFSVFFLLMPRTLQIPCSWLVEVQTNRIYIYIYIINVFVGLPRLKDICSVFGLYCSKARPVPSREWPVSRAYGTCDSYVVGTDTDSAHRSPSTGTRRPLSAHAHLHRPNRPGSGALSEAL